MKEANAEVYPISLLITFNEGIRPSLKTWCHFYTPAEDSSVDLYICEGGKLRRFAMYNQVTSVEEVTA